MIKDSYYERHKEERLEYQKRYNEKNKYEIKERVKTWRGENREKIREYNRAYYANNKEKYLNRYRDRLAKIEELEKENKKLKEELGEYKKMFEDQLKEVYIKNTAKFLDKKFPKINGFIEEDTLQELKDLGKI